MTQKKPKMVKNLVILTLKKKEKKPNFFINKELEKYGKRVRNDNDTQWDVEQSHHQVPSKSH